MQQRDPTVFVALLLDECNVRVNAREGEQSCTQDA